MLEYLFGSKTRLKLLQLFFRMPERAFFVRELARLIETQLNAVRRELANLEQFGIISQVPAGTSKEEEAGTERSKYYKLKKDFILYPEMKALLLKSRDLEEQRLVDEIKKKAGAIKLLVLTGIFVQSTEEVSTDLLLVGQIKALVVSKIIKDFEKLMGKPVRYTIMDEKEFGERREIGDRFLYNIFEAKHVVAIDELGIT